MPVSKSNRCAGVKVVATVVAGLGFVGTAGSAKADIIITQTSPLNGGTPGVYNGVSGYWFTYDALLSFNSELTNNTTNAPYGGFTTLYDAGVGNVPVNRSAGSYLAKDFTLTEPMVSPAAYRSTPTDAPTLTNLLFTFTGATDPTIVGGPYLVYPIAGNTSTSIQVGTMPVDLGQFQIFSTSDIENYVSFDGQSSTAFGSAVYAEQGNNSTTTVPSTVPEPASLALIGMAGTALLARRRKA
jgi:hypothetical protein